MNKISFGLQLSGREIVAKESVVINNPERIENRNYQGSGHHYAFFTDKPSVLILKADEVRSDDNNLWNKIKTALDGYGVKGCTIDQKGNIDTYV